MQAPRKVIALGVETSANGYVLRPKGLGQEMDALEIGHDQARLLWISLASAFKDCTPQSLGAQIVGLMSIEHPGDSPSECEATERPFQ